MDARVGLERERQRERGALRGGGEPLVDEVVVGEAGQREAGARRLVARHRHREGMGELYVLAHVARLGPVGRVGELVTVARHLPRAGLGERVEGERVAVGIGVVAEDLSTLDQPGLVGPRRQDRKSTRLNSSHKCATRMPYYA